MKYLEVKNVQDLGCQFVNNPNRMIGQDGAFSIPLNGKSLWFFGDTLIGERVLGESLWYLSGEAVGPDDMSGKGTIEKMLNNTGLLLPDQCAKDGLWDYKYICDNDGNIRTLIPLLENEDLNRIRVWCQHGVYLDDKIYLSFIKVRMMEQSLVEKKSRSNNILPVNFEIIGSGLAVGMEDDWKFQRIIHNDTDILWVKDVPHFGSAIFPNYNENKLYLYGVLMDSKGVQKCYVARVGLDKIEDLDSYEYLISQTPEWSSDINDAMAVFEGAPSEVSVSFNSYLNCYLAVHSWGTTPRIVGRTAPNLWGPWSEPVELWIVNKKREKPLPYPLLIYAGKEHPELADENGKIIYITYIEFEEYFPHLVKVTLE